nr:EAL domain-containing protein [Clostridium yunnanense]
MDLKKALYMKQFLLYFQPQFNIDNGSIESAEVLIRWKHEIEGLIKPDKFIKIIEENNFGIEFGNWVIRESCRQNMIWRQKGLQPIPLSVNISQGQFYDKNFISNLENILLEFDLEPEYLQLEITERIFIDSYERALNIIKNIKSLGIKVALDDFGTGNSSLISAMSLPFDIIKLDKFFLNNIEYDLRKRQQTTVIFKFLKSINDNIIIEGIENNTQLEFVKENGFNKVQGFLLSQPLECSNFEKLLKQNKVVEEI